MTTKYKCRYCHLVMQSKPAANFHRCSLMPTIPASVPTPENAFTIIKGIEPFASSAQSQSSESQP